MGCFSVAVVFWPTLVLTLHLLHYKNLPREEIFGSPHFFGVSACSQVMETLRRLLSGFTDFQLPSDQSNPFSKMIYIRVAHSDLLQNIPYNIKTNRTSTLAEHKLIIVLSTIIETHAKWQLWLLLRRRLFSTRYC